MKKEEADKLLRKFRSECLPFGEYPDCVILDFLEKEFKEYLPENTYEFTAKIEEQEIELDAGMRAVFKNKSRDERGCFDIYYFNSSGFDEHNDPLMKSNYYDDNINPISTAKEAGYWPKNDIHEVYVDDGVSPETYFTKIN